MNIEISKHLRFNFIVNILDGGFFGMALGLASFVTVLPLFVSSMTDSAILIGLIPAIHTMGWQLPQMLTANRVAHLNRFKPMVILMTIQERLPFLGLAVVAWFLPSLKQPLGLWLTFALLVWQGLGGGFTATAWQSMIGKIIPAQRRGVFFGMQASAANLLSSGAAVLAGIILDKANSPRGFALCFLLAGVVMVISWVFLALTREPASPSPGQHERQPTFWSGVKHILMRDADFRLFLLGRTLFPLGTLAFAFYTVYAVRQYNASASAIGLITAVYMVAQVIANPLLGWLGDHWNHGAILEIGALAGVASALLAALAQSVHWFYLVFILAGIAGVAFWTISLAMTLEFGTLAQRPTYISLSNTLVAPSTFLAPVLGGWLADSMGYKTAFLASAVLGLAPALIFHLMRRSPRNSAGSATTQDVNLCSEGK